MVRCSFPALVPRGSVFSCEPSTSYEGTYEHAMADCHLRRRTLFSSCRTHACSLPTTRLHARTHACTHARSHACTYVHSPTCNIVVHCAHIANPAYRHRFDLFLLFFISSLPLSRRRSRHPPCACCLVSRGRVFPTKFLAPMPRTASSNDRLIDCFSRAPRALSC